MQNDANKKIAIMYTSDYGYAASNECSKELFYYDEDSKCIKTNNWLDKSTYTWLFPQFSDAHNCAFIVIDDGYVRYGDVSSDEFAVHPVLYLSSNVKISGGSGTSSDPYKLSL